MSAGTWGEKKLNTCAEVLFLWGQNVKTSAVLLRNEPAYNTLMKLLYNILIIQVHYTTHYLKPLSESTYLLLTFLDKKNLYLEN